MPCIVVQELEHVKVTRLLSLSCVYRLRRLKQAG